jgi:putative hemolysin
MIEIILILFCLVLNAFLAAAEMAFITVGRPALRELAKSGNLQAKSILKLREIPERTLSIIQVGITLVGALAAALGGAGAEESIEPLFRVYLNLGEGTSEVLAILTVVVPITFLSVVIGELVPKALALKYPLRIALKTANWLVISDKIFSPIVGTLEWSTKKFLKVFFSRSKSESHDSLHDTVDLDHLSGQARQYVMNLVNTERKKVKDIVLPWDQVISIGVDQSIEAVEDTVLNSRHTRLPVLEGDKVVGIINTKELLAIRRAGAETWSGIIRPVITLQESDTLLKALKIMQDQRSHLSVIYSQDSKLGIVTIEDVLEEFVGEIYDEDDDGNIKKILSSRVALKTL